jgi:basic membrane lipoprotein Med (substrate-binding protein (PBP1-ABC) superfamily)
MKTNRSWIRLLAVLAGLLMFAAACGGSSSDASSDGADDATDDAADTDTEGEAEGEADGEADAAPAGDALKIAIVAPSAKDDLAFSQSMIDALDALDVEIDLSITDGTFVVEDAAAAIRGYAEEGNDIVIAHGTQFGASLAEIAPDFPEVTFVWGTATDTQGLDNVFAYYPAAEEGGYVNGVMAAAISETGVVGVVGPVEAGDAVAYINGFAEGAEASGATEVAITYTGSFGDVALAAEAAQAHLTNDVDVLTGSAQMVVGAVGVAAENDVPWFATQANQASLAPSLVVASQVYHWEIILEQILALRAEGVIGGEAFEVNLANGGLVIEFNDGYDLPAEVRTAADAAIASIIDGSIDPAG